MLEAISFADCTPVTPPRRAVADETGTMGIEFMKNLLEKKAIFISRLRNVATTGAIGLNTTMVFTSGGLGTGTERKRRPFFAVLMW